MNELHEDGVPSPSGQQAPEGLIGFFDIFPWSSDFETGIAFMDEQHQTLVRLLNLLARKLVVPSSTASCDHVLRELSEYAVYHFQSEEQLMRQFLPGDIAESEHLQAHRGFAEQIEQLKTEAGADPDGAAVEKLVAFLSHWLAYHILDTDRRMAMVVRAVQAGTPLAEAKLQADKAMSGAVRKLIEAVLGMYDILSSRTLQLMKEVIERQRVEIALSEQKKLLATVFETALDAVVLMNSRGVITGWNEQAEKIFGWSKAEAIGRKMDDTIVPARYRTHHAMGLAFFLATGEGPALNHRFETEALHRDGHEFPVELAITPIRTEDGYEFSAFVRDISERKQQEAELEKHRRHLEEVVRQRTADLTLAKEAAESANRAKNAFLAKMSHELRTPMNGIVGMAELAHRRATDAAQADQIGTVIASSEHLLALINDVLDLAKIEAEKLTLERIQFRLNDILVNVADVLEGRAVDQGLDFVIDVAPEVRALSLFGDPLRITQILANLTGNAIKFTDKGTTTIHAEIVEEHPDDLLLRFEVADTGIGISPEDQRRLFNAFEQADNSSTRKYGGTGLGLALSKRLSKMMGGEIGVESQPGVGSTFWFTARVARVTETVTPKVQREMQR